MKNKKKKKNKGEMIKSFITLLKMDLKIKNLTENKEPGWRKNY